MTQTFDMVMRRFEMAVGDQDQVDLEARLDFGDIRAFLIQQESRHINRHLRVHGRCVFFHGLFLEQTQDLQGAGLCITDHACAITARAGDVRSLV